MKSNPDEPEVTGVAGSDRSSRPARRWVTNLALLVSSVIVALVAGEVATRVLKPQQLLIRRPDIWQPVDTLGWAHRPYVSTTINTGERTVHVFTDSIGFRVGEAGRPDADVDVLILGDSFMAALQVEYEQSIAGLLEARLSRDRGQPVAVWNGGVGAWQPAQYLLRAEQMLATSHFDVVLVAVYLGNDIGPKHRSYFPPRTPRSEGFRRPRRFTYTEFLDAIVFPLTDVGHAHSHLFTLAWLNLDWARSKRILIRSRFPPVYLKEYADRPDWAVTADICAEIAAVSRSHGAEVVFLLIPSALQVDERIYERSARRFGVDTATVDLEQPNRLLGTELRDRGLTVVDPLPALRAAHASGTPVNGSVDRHFSPEGNRVVASELAPVLERLLAWQEVVSDRPVDVESTE